MSKTAQNPLLPGIDPLAVDPSEVDIAALAREAQSILTPEERQELKQLGRACAIAEARAAKPIEDATAAWLEYHLCQMRILRRRRLRHSDGWRVTYDGVKKVERKPRSLKK